MARPSALRRAASAKALLLALFLLLSPAAAPAADDPPPKRTDPVVVTATRGERGLLEVPGNVTLIERDAIEASGVQSVPELLRREAGLFVTNTTTNPVGTQVESRGFNNGGALGSGLLVLVDGRRANEADTGNTDWALIPLDDVERIEIVRGPASASYGDNAVGGVVHIITRPGPGPQRATLRASGGSWNAAQGSLRLAGSEGPWRASLFAGGLRGDGYRDRSAFRAVDLDGELELQLGQRVSLGLGGGLHDDEREFPGALTALEIAMFGRRAADPGALDDSGHVRRGLVRAWLEAQLGDQALLRIQPYYSGRKDDVAITILGFGGATPFTIDTDKASGGVDAQIQVDRSIGPFVNRLLVGGAVLHEDTDRDIVFAGSLGVSRNDRTLYSGFVQNEIHLTPDLLVSGGVRFDYADYSIRVRDASSSAATKPHFDVWSPKAAVSYRVLEPLSLYFSYAKGFRLPNFDEDAPLLPFMGMGPVVLPDLRPQRSESYEVGTKLQSERVRGNLALYRMEVRNEIVFDPTTFGNENFDRVRHQGLEASLSGQVLPWLELYGTYTLEDVQIRRYSPNAMYLGRRMPLTPLHRGSVGLFATLPCGFETRAHANLVGERFFANDFQNTQRRLEAYATLDLFLAWRPPLERLLGEAAEHLDARLHFGVRNLAGEEYAEFGAVSAFSDPVINPAPQRSFAGGLSLTVRR